MKERPKTFTSWWKHKRKFGKRQVAKINRRRAKQFLSQEAK